MQVNNIIRNIEGNILDLGSGAGFPGLIIAILEERKVHLVESNSKKCAFLREAIRITSCNAEVHNVRLTTKSAPILNISKVDIVTARAVTSLVNLLDIVFPIVYEDTYCIFHKGSHQPLVETEKRMRAHHQMSSRKILHGYNIRQSTQ